MVRYALPSTFVLALALSACGGATPVDGAGTSPLDTSTTTGGGEPTPPATADVPAPTPSVDPGPAPSATAEQPTEPGAKSPSELVAAADGARGEKLYEEMKCKGCHGSSAKPSTKFPKLFGLSWEQKRLDRAFRVIKKGESPMPGFEGKLDDAQIADIVRFLQDG